MPFTVLCLMISLLRLHYENRSMRLIVWYRPSIRPYGEHANIFILQSAQEQVSGLCSLVGIAYIGL